jgi:hypothetical protein
VDRLDVRSRLYDARELASDLHTWVARVQDRITELAVCIDLGTSPVFPCTVSEDEAEDIRQRVLHLDSIIDSTLDYVDSEHEHDDDGARTKVNTT